MSKKFLSVSPHDVLQPNTSSFLNLFLLWDRQHFRHFPIWKCLITPCCRVKTHCINSWPGGSVKFLLCFQKWFLSYNWFHKAFFTQILTGKMYTSLCTSWFRDPKILEARGIKQWMFTKIPNRIKWLCMITFLYYLGYCKIMRSLKCLW